jgi:hypothetical protein
VLILRVVPIWHRTSDFQVFHFHLLSSSLCDVRMNAPFMVHCRAAYLNTPSKFPTAMYVKRGMGLGAGTARWTCEN